MFNVEIRDAIKNARLYNYEVAKAIGMTETSFSRVISRKEMSPETKMRVLQAIETLTKK